MLGYSLRLSVMCVFVLHASVQRGSSRLSVLGHHTQLESAQVAPTAMWRRQFRFADRLAARLVRRLHIALQGSKKQKRSPQLSSILSEINLDLNSTKTTKQQRQRSSRA